MALPSFFKRKDPRSGPPMGAEPGAEDAGPVQAARVRARRRLIGAVVLLAIGVIGFPMLFETQPRPLPGDIAIDLPRREGAIAPPAAAEAPAPRAPGVVNPTPAATPSPASAAAPARPDGSTLSSAAPPASVPPASPAPNAAPSARPADGPVEGTRPAPLTSDAAAPATARDAAARKAEAERARALLEGRPVAAAAPAVAASDLHGGRYVVQVGAYTDAGTLRSVRAKVEGLGLKTYTQSIETDAGTRTRVRVGPFGTRQEAEAASSKLKDAGLPGNVLTL